MGIPMLLYGVALNEAIDRGNLTEMRELATVSGFLLRNNSSDLEDDEVAEWREAQKMLVAAISEKESIKIAREDIVAVRDGIVVIDSIQFARALKTLLSSDTEGPYISVTVGWD